MTTADLRDLDSVDLADPAVWDDGPPYELFARMQREAPVHFSPQRNAPEEGGFWSITCFDDIRTVSRDHKTFSSERRGIFNVDDMGVPLDLQRLHVFRQPDAEHGAQRESGMGLDHQRARHRGQTARELPQGPGARYQTGAAERRSRVRRPELRLQREGRSRLRLN